MDARPGLDVPRSLIPATLGAVRRCPARADYIELAFQTCLGRYHWCISETRDVLEVGAIDGLAIALGPYGVVAHEVQKGRFGYAITNGQAAQRIRGGAKVLVEASLVDTSMLAASS